MKTEAIVDMRKRIVDAAILIAARSGFTRATTKEIARQAKCSEGIIYHYFKSKRELFLAVITERGTEFLEQLHTQLKGIKTAEDKIDKLVDFHFSYFTGKLHIFQILFGKSGDAVVPFPYLLKVFILPYLQSIEKIIREGIDSGEFQKINVAVVASSLLGMMQFNIIKIHFGVSGNAVEEIKDSIKPLILNVLLKGQQEGQKK